MTEVHGDDTGTFAGFASCAVRENLTEDHEELMSTFTGLGCGPMQPTAAEPVDDSLECPACPLPPVLQASPDAPRSSSLASTSVVDTSPGNTPGQDLEA